MKINQYITCLLLLISFNGYSQLVYQDVSSFPLLGKISPHTESRYERLPAHIKDQTRAPVWNLGKSTAGLSIRFLTNSTKIGVKWELLNNTVMNHMAFTGIKGLDLYVLENGEWEFVNAARPTDKINESTLVSNMTAGEREYMLYLPLYDGVISLEIGVDSTSYLSYPKEEKAIDKQKPIIWYGTSILQGGCASRPGMAVTNILSRQLHREIVNLGFSGNAKLDYEIAGIIAEADPQLIILDFVPNTTLKELTDKTEEFYKIIREKQPNTPILFVENPIFPTSRLDNHMKQNITNKNNKLNEIFQKLKDQGDQNIKMVNSSLMIGLDGEATVDGIHFTDLGFKRYADFIHPFILKEIN